MTVIRTETNRQDYRSAVVHRLETVNRDRALVPVSPPEAPAPRFRQPRPSVFLAHLVATRDLAPQTRDLRRVEPAEAMHAYRFALNAVERETSTTLSLTI